MPIFIVPALVLVSITIMRAVRRIVPPLTAITAAGIVVLTVWQLHWLVRVSSSSSQLLPCSSSSSTSSAWRIPSAMSGGQSSSQLPQWSNNGTHEYVLRPIVPTLTNASRSSSSSSSNGDAMDATAKITTALWENTRKLPKLLRVVANNNDNNTSSTSDQHDGRRPHYVFLLDAIWIPPARTTTTTTTATDDDDDHGGKLVLLAMSSRMFANFAHRQTAKVHSRAYNQTFWHQDLVSPMALVPHLSWNNQSLFPNNVQRRQLDVHGGARTTTNDDEGVVHTSMDDLLLAEDEVCRQVPAVTADGNLNHKLYVVHCRVPSSSSSRRQQQQSAVLLRYQTLVLAQFDASNNGSFNAAGGMRHFGNHAIQKQHDISIARNRMQLTAQSSTQTPRRTPRLVIVIKPLAAYHPLLPDILDYYRKQGVEHVYLGLVHPTRALLDTFDAALQDYYKENFVSLGWYEANHGSGSGSSSTADVTFDYTKDKGHMLLQLMFANSALYHAKAVMMAATAAAAAAHDGQDKNETNAGGEDNDDALLMVVDLHDVLVSTHPTKSTIVQALATQMDVDSTCYAVPPSHVVWRTTSLDPQQQQQGDENTAFAFMATLNTTDAPRLGELFPKRCTSVEASYHKSIAVLKNCDFVGLDDHGACREGTYKQLLDGSAVSMHRYTSLWGKTRKRCSSGPGKFESQSELAQFQKFEVADEAPLVVVVPGLASANRLASIKKSLQQLSDTAEHGLRCIVYISNETLAKAASTELVDCDVVYNEGLWTHHMLRVDESVVNNATHIAVLTDSVDVTNVDASSFLQTMNHANYDVASAAIPGWHYDVLRPREDCKSHRTDFTDITFTVFGKKAWMCWIKRMDVDLNERGWGYDVTMAETCDVHIGIIDDAIAVYEGSCETDDDGCMNTSDKETAMSQLREWLARISGVRTEAEARSYWKHIVFYRPKLFRQCDLLHSTDEPRRIPEWQTRADLDTRGNDSISRFLFSWSVQGDAIAGSALLPVASNYTRQCTSPERKVAWPLSGSVSSASSPLSCGISEDTTLAMFFRELQFTLKRDYGEQCQEWVRFGVAFGSKFVEKLTPVHKAPHKCAFMFVLADETPQKLNNTLSFGQERLLPIPRDVLPYRSLRRNVKLFKLHGHVLFPFAKHLVWQDAKLKGKVLEPVSYFSRFLQTDLGSPCLTTVGLPIHKNTFGKKSRSVGYLPQFQDHCDAVADAIVARPSVTDSVDSLLEQCRTYQQHDLPGVTLNRGLIDSAFILWNQESPRCRDFNAKLACTWSDEIQCFSDRDQIPFPYVLKRLGARESRFSKHKKAARNSVYLVDDNDEQTVQILRSDCHWYYNSFPRWCSED